MNKSYTPTMDGTIETNFLERMDPQTKNTLHGLFICPVTLCLSFVFIADKMHVPNQLLAMIYGTLIGLVYYFVPYVHKETLFFWKPDNVIALCHPIMLAKIAMDLDVYVFSKSKWQIMIVATIGTGMFIGLFGFLVIIMTNVEVNLVNIVAAGTTLAAIDVPDVLNELNKIKNLEVVMDGESVFGAALCIMTYNFCVGHYTNIVTEWYHPAFLYARFIIVGLILGYVIGRLASLSFRWFYQDSYNATVTLLATCYAAYYVCELYVFCSATICTFFVGFYICKERYRLSPTTEAKLRIFIDNAYQTIEFINCIVLSATVTYAMVGMYKGFDFAVAIGVYIMGNVFRIFIFVLLWPILSRMGLGFNITTLLTISWAAKRGSLQLLQVVFIAYYNVTQILGTELLCFTVVYLTLSFLINMTSLQYILKYFGLIEFTMARKYNITQCITNLINKKHRVMFALKTNRLLSDLNWELIHRATTINNPYASIGEHEEAHEFETTCPTCNRSIPYLSSAKEQHELIKYVRAKVLRRQRITLVRHFELGLLRKTELEIILQYIEVALNSNELKVPYNYFLEWFNVDKNYVKWHKRLDMKKNDLGPMIRRNWAIYDFTSIFKQAWFTYLKMTINILSVILIITWIFLSSYHVQYSSIVLWIGYAVSAFFIIEHVVNIFSFTCLSLYYMYFKTFWNLVGISLVLLDLLAFIPSIIFDFHHIRHICLIRVFYFEQLFIYIIPYIHQAIDKKVDKDLANAYCFGLALVTSLQEVQANLYSLCKIANVREFIASQVQYDKMRIMEKLAIVQYTRPHVAVTISTFQLKMAVLKSMHTTAKKVKAAGVVEENEYKILKEIIEKAIMNVHPTTVVKLNSAKTILREIPWLGSDDDMFEYLYSNIMLRIWESGDVICDKGDYVDGVIILMQGLLKMTYEPDEEILYNLNTYGMLPVKELLTSMYFSESEEEYLFMGNTIGELSYLTKRPFDCRIEAVRSSSGLIITKAILNLASNFNTDPIFGFICQMWKHVSCVLMYRTLYEKGHYHDIAVTTMHSLIHRAFVPNISHYRILQMSNYIDDVILIDGVVTDRSTDNKYIAPCYIPRTVPQLQIQNPRNSGNPEVNPKIVVIPRMMIDSYTVMKTTEDISDTIHNPNSTAPIGNQSVRRRKREGALHMSKSQADVRINSKNQIDKMYNDSINETKVTSIIDYLSNRKMGY